VTALSTSGKVENTFYTISKKKVKKKSEKKVKKVLKSIFNQLFLMLHGDGFNCYSKQVIN